MQCFGNQQKQKWYSHFGGRGKGLLDNVLFRFLTEICVVLAVVWLHFIFMENKTWKKAKDPPPCSLKAGSVNKGPGDSETTSPALPEKNRWVSRLYLLAWGDRRQKEKQTRSSEAPALYVFVPVQFSSQTLSPLCRGASVWPWVTGVAPQSGVWVPVPILTGKMTSLLAVALGHPSGNSSQAILWSSWGCRK